MAYLLDSNILVRLAQRPHPARREAAQAVRTLLRRPGTLHIVPQVLYEFWVVATRPIAVNGLGLSIPEAFRRLGQAESFFTLTLDTPAIYREWTRLVEAYAVSGVASHDARLVAAMRVHGIDRVLTFNVADFGRFHGSEVTVESPADVIQTTGGGG
ncbi:MAG: type II toxin-antitoxin system VapC family toxin [Limisphaerales bacterium]